MNIAMSSNRKITHRQTVALPLVKMIKNWVDAHKYITIPLTVKVSEVLVWGR